MVYVDSGPGVAAADQDFTEVEKPLPSPDELSEQENLTGLSEEQLETFRRRAIPQPGGMIRGFVPLTDEARLDIPTTMICTGYTSDEYKGAVAEGWDWLGGLRELRNVTWVDLPTSHWPMWSKPKELAEIIADVARKASTS
jgi:hypothetical protein